MTYPAACFVRLRRRTRGKTGETPTAGTNVMFERFTEGREVMTLANQEARRFNHGRHNTSCSA